MNKISFAFLTISGLSFRIGAMILTEIGDFSRFDTPDGLLAYTGISPSICQSDRTESSHSHMEKRGSQYMRYAMVNATKYVCLWDPTFETHLANKRAEGKYYNVTITHATKKTGAAHFCHGEVWKPYIKAV